MKCLTIRPSGLSGQICVPPSKSMAHRAIICALLSEGESVIDNIELSDDIIATCRAAECLGGDIDILESGLPGRKKLVIRGYGSIKIKNERINCGESGTTARFIIPVSRLSGDRVMIEGEGRLVERPFSVFFPVFDSHGIEYKASGGNLPMTLRGNLRPGNYQIQGNVSSQFISGLLLALPLLPGDSVISVTTSVESAGYIDMTIAMQKLFGVKIDYRKEENRFIIPGWQKYLPRNYEVEGDWSQAAFWLAAGALSGPVKVEGLNPDSHQGDKIIEELLKNMGAELTWQGTALISEKSRMSGIGIDASNCPDLVPVLAVLGAASEGTTEIKNAGRLRLKECDRLKAITTELRSLGGSITENEDSLYIKGREKLLGGRVYGWNDHRIVMAAAVAAVACEKNVVIEGCDAVSKSYPSFWEHYTALGGEVL